MAGGSWGWDLHRAWWSSIPILRSWLPERWQSDPPTNRTRETIIAELELEYYGIMVTSSLKGFMRTLNGDIQKSGETFYAAQFAAICIGRWHEEGSRSGEVVSTKITLPPKNISDELCRIQPDHHKRKASVNFYLNQIGLQIVDLRPRKCSTLKEI